MKKARHVTIDSSSMILPALLTLIMGVMFALVFCNEMQKINAAVAQLCMEWAGYKARINIVVTKEQEIEVLPVLGTGVLEQPLFFGKELQEQKQLMLGIKMAAYDRKNYGTLYVELVQGKVSQCFQMEMNQVRDNGEMRLLFETEPFQEGEIRARIYAPESTGENCVAVYAVGNTKDYLPLVVNGEMTYKNAVICSYIPSKYARSDFVQWREE